jgi:hypothetical protein
MQVIFLYRHFLSQAGGDRTIRFGQVQWQKPGRTRVRAHVLVWQSVILMTSLRLLAYHGFNPGGA